MAPQLHTPLGSFSCTTAEAVDEGLATCEFSVPFLTSLLTLLRPPLFAFDEVVVELDILDLLLDPLLVVVVVLERSSWLPILLPKMTNKEIVIDNLIIQSYKENWTTESKDR